MLICVFCSQVAPFIITFQNARKLQKPIALATFSYVRSEHMQDMSMLRTLITASQESSVATRTTLKVWSIVLSGFAGNLAIVFPEVRQLWKPVKSLAVNRAHNLPYNNSGCPHKKLGAKKCLHLFGFSTTSRLNGEYLLNKTWHEQSDKGTEKHEGSPTLSKKFMNFGPQTA